MDKNTLEYYAANSATIARRYRTVAGGISDQFSNALRGCARVLDVGCGAGCDLVRLLQLGHNAVGTDACREMLDEAAATCRAAGYDLTDRLVLDHLPELSAFPDAGFDAVVCSAVLMHLPEEQLFDAVYALRRVLRPIGRLLVSIPARRRDVNPETRRDPEGRYFADLPPARLRLLLERVGFDLLQHTETADAQGRPDTAWATLLFSWRGAETERPLDQVESILNRDKKDATYKLALFRALAEIAQAQYNIARFESTGRVHIPISAVAEKWFAYYWPVVESETFIAQKNGERPDGNRPIAIRRPLRSVMEAFKEGGGLPAFLTALRNNALRAEVRSCYAAAIRKVEHTIWNMPVRYAGGGKDFSVLGYDRKTRTITMPEELWRELSLTGGWIADATVLRWAELTERLSKGAVPISLIVEKLLSISDPERETREARNLFKQVGVAECVWTGRPLRMERFDVDHVIPFSLWRNNDLWNLLPSHPSANNEKRDRLPTLPLLHRRRDAIIGCWEVLRGNLADRFDREAAALCGLGRWKAGNWQICLFATMSEAVEVTAIQRHAERWEPTVRSTGTVPQLRMSSMTHTKAQSGANTPVFFGYAAIEDEAYKHYLPVIGALAAGTQYSGFDISYLEEVRDCPWLEVPETLAGPRRFVVRIAGDSMEPELQCGDLAIFEYHRTPRESGQIVIANLAEFGLTSDLATTNTVKRIRVTEDAWVFEAVNPLYESIHVLRAGCDHPILGVMVGKARSADI